MQSGIILALLLLLVVLAYVLQKVTPLPHTVVSESTDTHFLYAPANIQFDIAEGWVLATNTVALPKNIEGLRFAFVKSGTPCVFAYVRMTNGAREAYVQTSFAERIFSGPNNANQFDSSWYIRKADTPPGFAFDWNARQPFRNEVRIMPPGYMGRWEYGDHFRAFLLYDSDGSIVPDACNGDVNAMLATMVEYYPTGNIESTTTGSIYIKGSKVLLLGDDDIARLVHQFPGGSSDFSVAGNRIYYRSGNTLHYYEVNLQVDAVNNVPPLGIDANRSYAISGTSIYSISDGSCAPDVPCRQKLYSMDIPSGISSFLGDVTANSIMGYSTKDQAVYVEWARGDAGCSGSAVSRYSIVRGTVEEVGNFGGCNGDPGFEESMAEYRALRTRIDGGDASFTHVDIRGGMLFAPDTNAFAEAGVFPLFVAQ